MFDWNQSTDITDNTDEESDKLDPFLCFPELMTKHQLLRIFKTRHLSPPKDLLIDGYDYYNLIALYNNVLLPLPQRKYTNKRKSKELSVKQIDCNKQSANKRKFEETIKTEDNSKQLMAKPTDQYSKTDINANRNGQQVSNLRNDTKRQKISWP